MKFPESDLAKIYLHPIIDRGGRGAEFGAGAHNDWGEKITRATVNVDYTDEFTAFKQGEIDLCGEFRKVDVVAYADVLPFEDSSLDFAIHSHCIEHVANPIRAHREWHRVLKPDGIIFAHVPHRDALPTDCGRAVTTLDHLIDDYEAKVDEQTHPFGGPEEATCRWGHYHVFTVHSYLQMIFWMNYAWTGAMFEVLEAQAVEQKVGNSFAIVLRVLK